MDSITFFQLHLHVYRPKGTPLMTRKPFPFSSWYLCCERLDQESADVFQLYASIHSEWSVSLLEYFFHCHLQLKPTHSQHMGENYIQGQNLVAVGRPPEISHCWVLDPLTFALNVVITHKDDEIYAV